MWWNLFTSNPCWVCHNNRFYFCGICWPLMGWVFASPEMVPVPQQRSRRFLLGRLRSASEPCQSGQQLWAKIIPRAAAAPVSPGPADQETTCLQKKHISSNIWALWEPIPLPFPGAERCRHHAASLEGHQPVSFCFGLTYLGLWWPPALEQVAFLCWCQLAGEGSCTGISVCAEGCAGLSGSRSPSAGRAVPGTAAWTWRKPSL